jgi:hypothetical protein
MPGKEDEVRRRLGSWARPIAGLVALTLALAGAVPVAAAEDARKAPLAASASAAVAAKPLPASALAQAAPASQGSSGSTDLGSKSFFKTPAGKISLVLMAAGTGYMVYSAFKDNDPVKSQFR